MKGQRLSSEAEISVVTSGPYQGEVYSAFGHSAIRIIDPISHLDVVFDYGVYDFEQANFYLNFTLGNPYFKLAKRSGKHFVQSMVEENRAVVQQNLNLNSEERQRIFNFLKVNARPEHSGFYYNYLYDNCATRIRSLFDSLFADQIEFDYSYVTKPISYRGLMDLYLQEQPWGDLAIDICLGPEIDKEATGHDYMYLPEFVEKALAGAVFTSSGLKRPLVEETLILNEHLPEPSVASIITPRVVCTCLLLLSIFMTYRELLKKRSSKWFDVILFAIAGVVGWLLLFLWAFTNHLSAYNFNLLWAMPFHLPVALVLFRSKRSQWVKHYFLLNLFILASLLIFWKLWPQDLNESILPLLLALSLRSFTQWKLVATA